MKRGKDMKRKKILAVLMSLAMVASIGSPAMLTTAQAQVVRGDEQLKAATTEKLTLGENTATMFKPVDASIVTDGDSKTLKVTMNGTGYEKLVISGLDNVKTTINEQTEANGWITATARTDNGEFYGKLEFSIPLTSEYLDEDGNYVIPCLAVSKNRLEQYTNGTEIPFSKIFYGRLLTVDMDSKTLTTADNTYNANIVEYIGDLDTDSDGIEEVEATVDLVDELIQVIKSQTKDENTERYCRLAKYFWDKLSTDDQAKVDDPDYFGLDTGKAIDDIDSVVNTSPTKSKEMLVVSFGTSYNINRAHTIGAIEKALQKAYPEYDVRRAFTAQIIINHILARDDVNIKNVEEALEDARTNGVKELVVVPTHLMSGAEYDELKAALDEFTSQTTYKADAFTFTGGTGKMKITCDQIQVKDGKATAKVVFSSKYVTQVKVGDQTYYPDSTVTNKSVFELPVTLNEDNEIVATTTAMSEPHDITYTIHPTLNLVEKVLISAPLLNSDADKTTVATSVVAEAAKDAGFASTDKAVADEDTAFVFMGHGTAHVAKETYTQMQAIMDKLGYKNCYIGTVEGEPEATSMESIIAKVKEAGYSKVVLRPLMVVAGDHANNDMAGDDKDSWKSGFEAAGLDVTCQIEGLGSVAEVQELYISHVSHAATTKKVEDITWTNRMFKVVDASVTEYISGQKNLVVTMSGTGYKNFAMYSSLAEARESLASDNREKWIEATTRTTNDEYNGMLQFTIPLNDYQQADGSYVIPFMAVSAKNLAAYEKGDASASKVFYGRKITLKDNTLLAEDYSYSSLINEQIGTLDTTDVAIEKVPVTVELVNDLIEAIQVQTKDENTERYCRLAKYFWNKLTEDQKEEVEEADYFGLDTGKAIKDNPVNASPSRSKEMLVVSFGTSYNTNRADTIGAIETALQKAYPDYDVRRAFTAQIIINHVLARDGVNIKNVEEALADAKDHGVKELVIVPTHLMSGAEYDELKNTIDAYVKANPTAFDKVTYSTPLLNSDADKTAVAKSVVAEAAKDAGFASTDKAVADEDTAFVFMGHGTAHVAKETYTQMQAIMDKLGYKNCYIGTVEGEPESTSMESIIAKVKAAGYSKVVLRPLMVVAGDHANNDMAGDDEDSWKSGFEAAGLDVTCQIKGLGSSAAVQNIYINHVKSAIATDLSKAKITIGKYSTTYNKKAKKPSVTVTVDGKKIASSNYTVSYKNNIKAGTATVTVTAKGTYALNSKSATFKITKASQPLKVTVKNQTVKYKSVKKANKLVRAIVKVTGEKTKKTYTKLSGNKKLTVNKKTGKITIKKGIKKGTYTLKIKVATGATANYKAGSKTVKVKIKVK